MPTRYDALVALMAGQEHGAPPLVGWSDGQYCAPLWYEEPGILYVVPRIANSFGLALPSAIDCFVVGLTAAGLASGLVGLMLQIRSWAARAVAVVGLLGLGAVTLKVSDVYIVFAVAAAGLVPWFILLRERATFGMVSAFLLVLAGLGIGMVNHVRSYAGTGVLLFAVAVLAGQRVWTPRQRTLGILCIFAGMLAPRLWFIQLQNNRDAFLTQRNAVVLADRRGHVFWHSVYIGLGFLNNPYGIEYRDESAIAAVATTDPSIAYCSRAYEEVLRAKVLALLKQDPLFVVKTAFAKTGVLLWYLVWAANLGLVAAFKYRKPACIDVAFAVSIAFNGLFGILVMPHENYCLGFISMGTLFGIISIGHAIDCGAVRDLRQWMRCTRVSA